MIPFNPVMPKKGGNHFNLAYLEGLFFKNTIIATTTMTQDSVKAMTEVIAFNYSYQLQLTPKKI